MSSYAKTRARCPKCGQWHGPDRSCAKPGRKPTPWWVRFRALIDQRGPDECWPWLGARLTGEGPKRLMGYGQFTLPGHATHYAHRLAYELAIGVIPEGLLVLHTCDNPACCNPAHLRVGTQAENLADMVERGRSSRGARHWNWNPDNHERQGSP